MEITNNNSNIHNMQYKLKIPALHKNDVPMNLRLYFYIIIEANILPQPWGHCHFKQRWNHAIQTNRKWCNFQHLAKGMQFKKRALLTVSEITFSLVKEKVLYQRRAIFKWDPSLIKMLRFTCHERGTGSIIQHLHWGKQLETDVFWVLHWIYGYWLSYYL